MALGFFLVFFGIQLRMVERYTMTPRMANFFTSDGVLRANLTSPAPSTVPTVSSPYYQASYSTAAPTINVAAPSRDLVPPRWLCWPVLFLGAVVFLHGFGKRRYGP